MCAADDRAFPKAEFEQPGGRIGGTAEIWLLNLSALGEVEMAMCRNIIVDRSSRKQRAFSWMATFAAIWGTDSWMRTSGTGAVSKQHTGIFCTE